MPRLIASALYQLHSKLKSFLSSLSRALYFSPIFRSKTSQCGKNLFLYGGLPYIAGPLDIQLGHNCRISGKTTFTGRMSNKISPQLIVGDNVDIGWQSTIAVGRKVSLGDNVRIAGGCFMAGYPGHPVQALARAKGLPDNDKQAKDIILDHDVWVGTGVTIIGGVHIGHSSIIAAGSVVTKSLPSGVLAGGNPATVIRKLSKNEE
ncbi:DapH/DapD/GlmU-related protein [Agaribacterium sp. ZY112]|uniref:acyltransferase n=1 Tax=Agaribacterium sp. ZY112 TaxID=3233574 RepID=UPI0035255657